MASFLADIWTSQSRFPGIEKVPMYSEIRIPFNLILQVLNLALSSSVKGSLGEGIGIGISPFQSAFQAP